ncbi:MAG: PKD domain-containing protein [Actinomycetales bacterium]
MLAVMMLGALPPAAHAGQPGWVGADYRFDEPNGASVLTDSSGRGGNGSVNPTAVVTGAVFEDSVGYEWPYRSPTEYPPAPERIVQVPDDTDLEPAGEDFTIELRFRFVHRFGNIIQKGQATTPGGQWKIQAPGGVPSCLFKGSAGRVATSAVTPLNDGHWHTLTCSLTPEGVTMYVDGEYRSRKLGSTGYIDNDYPMTIGGKLNCNQINVTCDYFTGGVDSVRITKGDNAAPVADFASSCDQLTCAFDGGLSSDPDGDVVGYQWKFGDGGVGSGRTPSHTYAQSGTYRVKLEARDNRGQTDTKVRWVTVEGQPATSTIGYVAADSSAGNSSLPQVQIPATAAPGDRAVLVYTMTDSSLPATGPDAPGWVQLGSATQGSSLRSTVWSKVIEPGEPGSPVTFTEPGTVKFSLTMGVWSGTGSATPVAVSRGSSDDTTTRYTPTVPASDGDWVVSYWSDKSSSTTSWTADPAAATRTAACGTGGGRVCSLMADTGQKVLQSYGEVPASTDSASHTALMWSIALPNGQ